MNDLDPADYDGPRSWPDLYRGYNTTLVIDGEPRPVLVLEMLSGDIEVYSEDGREQYATPGDVVDQLEQKGGPDGTIR